ncbi:MAG: ABC transporter substrate-binding protein [Eggerthellaceae bacterium]|nr:ABC transporter substrate-binding protein [Eggerthellaceae bacterium]
MALNTRTAVSRVTQIVAIILLALVVCLAVLLARALLDDNSQQTDAAVDDKTDISYSWWGNDGRHRYTVKGLDDFTAKNPDIAVSPTYGVWDGYEQRYTSMMRAREERDVMQVNYAWLATYSPDGTGYYDLNALSDQIDLSQFTDRDLAFGTRNGTLNALPIAYNMPVFYYNQSLLDQYGLTVPRTWDDLFACARVLRAHDVSTLCLNDKQLWMCMLAWYEQTTGTRAFDENGVCQIDQAGFESMIAQCNRMVSEGVIDLDGDSPSQQFANGTTAGVVIWASDATRYCQPVADAGQTVVLGPNPGITGPSTIGWYLKPATMLAISAHTAHPEEAARLVNYLLNDPDYALLQGTEKGVPASKTARETLADNGKLSGFEEEATEQMQDHKDELDPMVPAMEDADIISAFKDSLRKYEYGRADLSQSAQELYAAVQESNA